MGRANTSDTGPMLKGKPYSPKVAAFIERSLYDLHTLRLPGTIKTAAGLKTVLDLLKKAPGAAKAVQKATGAAPEVAQAIKGVGESFPEGARVLQRLTPGLRATRTLPTAGRLGEMVP